MSILSNTLYHADCLVLLERMPDNSVDMIYADPPWNITDGTFRSDREYARFMSKVIRQFWRILSPTGNLLLHLAPEAANSTIRGVLETVFKIENLRPEIPLPTGRRNRGIRTGRYATHELILQYAKSEYNIRNPIIIPLSENEAKQMGYQPDSDGRLFRPVDMTGPQPKQSRPVLYYEFRGYYPPEGRTWKYSHEKLAELEQMGKIYQPRPDQRPRLKQYLDEHGGQDVTDDWSKLTPGIVSREHQYSGQKSLELMNRLVQINSNPKEIVLDVFCGSGTTLVAAHNNGRQWIGCDNEDEACNIVRRRLSDQCGLTVNQDYRFVDQQTLADQYDVVRTSAFPKYFISYSRKDEREFVIPFCQKLEAEMIDYWQDRRDIEIGEVWERRLQEGLDECEAMILFISPESLSSDYVRREYEAFLKANKPILSLLCSKTYIPPELSRLQYLPYDEHDRLIERLLKQGF